MSYSKFSTSLIVAFAIQTRANAICKVQRGQKEPHSTPLNGIEAALLIVALDGLNEKIKSRHKMLCLFVWDSPGVRADRRYIEFHTVSLHIYSVRNGGDGE